jgi:hypothetical protein
MSFLAHGFSFCPVWGVRLTPTLASVAVPVGGIPGHQNPGTTQCLEHPGGVACMLMWSSKLLINAFLGRNLIKAPKLVLLVKDICQLIGA